MKRLIKSLVAGAVVATVLVVFEDTGGHAALVRAAAQPQPHGGHQSVASILTAGFAGTAFIVALVVFLASSVLAHRRNARTAAARRAWQGTPEPRRRGRAGAWR